MSKDAGSDDDLARAERLMRDVQRFATFRSTRSAPLPSDRLLQYLIERVSRQVNLGALRVDAYFDLSFLEFARLDLLIADLRNDLLTVEIDGDATAPIQNVDDDTQCIRLTAKGERLLHCIRALHALESDANLILPIEIVDPVAPVDEGTLVKCIHPAWIAILSRIHTEPTILHQLHWRTVEELVAAAYDRDGWEVTLTPRSSDRGRDIIAFRRDIGAVRVFDQVKAFAPGRRVTAHDVRALNGILRGNVSKGVITTTSEFAPGVAEEFADLIPSRLELRTGKDLLNWIQRLSVGLLKY
jgi:restriction system protein